MGWGWVGWLGGRGGCGWLEVAEDDWVHHWIEEITVLYDTITLVSVQEIVLHKFTSKISGLYNSTKGYSGPNQIHISPSAECSLTHSMSCSTSSAKRSEGNLTYSKHAACSINWVFRQGIYSLRGSEIQVNMWSQCYVVLSRVTWSCGHASRLFESSRKLTINSTKQLT